MCQYYNPENLNVCLQYYTDQAEQTGYDMAKDNKGNMISRENYKYGQCYFAFDLTLDEDDSGHWDLIKEGSTSIELTFPEGIPATDANECVDLVTGKNGKVVCVEIKTAEDAAWVLDNLMEGLQCKGYMCKPNNFKIAIFVGSHTTGFKICLEELCKAYPRQIGGFSSSSDFSKTCLLWANFSGISILRLGVEDLRCSTAVDIVAGGAIFGDKCNLLTFTIDGVCSATEELVSV
uniref:Uncharacterized protein n=1 Tax=Romanomermis culicivorax TaxID=13658 RepID=A0A915J3L7_ROMCU